MNLCREKTGREDASQHATTKKCLSGTPRARKTAGQQREDPRRLECHFALFRNRPQVRPHAIKEGIEFDGQQDLQTKVMIALFGLFAEVERDLISERTKEGLAAAKAQGKLLGRPKGALGKSRLDGKEQDIRVLLGKNVSKASIAKILDVSRSALYHFIETLAKDRPKLNIRPDRPYVVFQQ